MGRPHVHIDILELYLFSLSSRSLSQIEADIDMSSHCHRKLFLYLSFWKHFTSDFDKEIVSSDTRSEEDHICL